MFLAKIDVTKFHVADYGVFKNHLRKPRFWVEKVLIRGARVLVLVLRGADFALHWFFGISWLFRFFKYVKNGHFSPRYHWFSHGFGIYIDIMHLCSLQKEVGPCFRESSTSVSQVHLHSTWEDEGVEAGFVDEGGWFDSIGGVHFVHHLIIVFNVDAQSLFWIFIPQCPCLSLFSSPIRRQS